jgi:hypothetical protein
MKAYRFLTRVSDSGAIQIPFEPALFDQEVEVIILTKPTPAKKELGAREFVQKWAGFLSYRDTDDTRFEYL